MRCHWELNNDNLLDLSHVSYVHAASFGGRGLERVELATERLARGVRASRWVAGAHPIPLWARYLNWQGLIDRWAVTDCALPGHCIVDVGFAPEGQIRPGEDRNRGLRLWASITATPETATTSFMFYAQVRNFGVEDAEMTRHFVEDGRGAFLEDVAAMEGQQRMNSARAGAPRIDINVDAAPLAMRQLVARALDAEAVVAA
jgi:vanillate O-demethylase monooxygenase subunit